MAKQKIPSGRRKQRGRQLSRTPSAIQANLSGFTGGLVREVGGQDVRRLELDKILTKRARREVGQRFIGEDPSRFEEIKLSLGPKAKRKDVEREAFRRATEGRDFSLIDLDELGITTRRQLAKGNFRTALEEQGLFTGDFLAAENVIQSRTGLGTGVLDGDPFIETARRQAEFEDRLDALSNRAFGVLDQQFALAEQGSAIQQAVLSGDFSNPLVSQALRGFQDQFRGGLAARGVPVTGGNILAEAQGGLAAALGIGSSLVQGGFGGIQGALGVGSTFDPLFTPAQAVNFNTQASAGIRFGQLFGIQQRAAESDQRFIEKQFGQQLALGGIGAGISGVSALLGGTGLLMSGIGALKGPTAAAKKA